jgi:hypothetical protein
LPLEEASFNTLNKWELAKETTLRHTNFTDAGNWHSYYIYQEDHRPSYNRMVAPKDERTSLYLSAHKRDYDKPGQDRLPQTLNQFTRVVWAPDGRFPRLRLEVLVDCPAHFERALLGAFVWVEGYYGHQLHYSLIYGAGKVPEQLGNRFNRSSDTVTVHRYLPVQVGAWHSVTLNPGQDIPLPHRPLDRWALNLGVWNINEGNNLGIGTYFSGLEQLTASTTPSQMDGTPLQETPQDLRYAFRVNHIAGEHVIADQHDLYFDN